VTSTVMTVTLSCDHRVIDGAVGAQWMQVCSFVHACLFGCMCVCVSLGVCIFVSACLSVCVCSYTSASEALRLYACPGLLS
jgi:hypothetical protein